MNTRTVPLRRTWLAAVLILLFGMYGVPVQAADQPPKTIVIGSINLDWFPFAYRKNGAITGFAIDAIKTIFSQMRQNVDFQSVPLAEGLVDIQAGNMHAYIGIGITPERQTLYDYPEIPLFSDETVLIGRTGDAFEFNGDVSTLIGHRIGIMKGAIHGPAFDNMTGIIRVPFNSGTTSMEEFMKNLRDGKYRFIAVNSRAGIIRYLKKLGVYDQFQVYEEPIAIKNYFLIFSKKMPAVQSTIKRFDKIHKLFRSTPEYEQLLVKYHLNRKLFPEWSAGLNAE